jgi:hypothetical protein
MLCAAGARGRIFQAASGADMPFLRSIVSCLLTKRARVTEFNMLEEEE